MRGEIRSKPSIILGAGGHAKVLLTLARECGRELLGVLDPALVSEAQSHWQGLAVLGDDAALTNFDPNDVDVMIGVGFMPGSGARRRLFDLACANQFYVPALVHPHAWVAPSARLDDGVQIMAGAVVQPDVAIGVNTIVNTGSRVDHDSVIGAHAHLAPGVIVCGDVRIGNQTFIGAGSVVIQGVCIGDSVVLGAGSVALGDVSDGECAVGVVKRKNVRNG